MTKLDLQISGLIDPETGRLSRPLPVDCLVRPESIKLDGDALVYDSWECDFLTIKPGDDLLGPFLRLADASAEGVLRYARRYGVLMLCGHGVPSTHNPFTYPDVLPEWAEPEWQGCDGSFFTGTTFPEPIDRWRMFARIASAVIEIAGALHGGRCGRSEDWRIIEEQADLFPSLWQMGRVENEWESLSSVLDQWAAIGNVRPRVRISKGSPELRLGGFLFGALGLQLMSAVSRSEGFAICSECGRAYVPKRRPRKDERHYCERCGRAAALRYAQQKRRQGGKTKRA